jgi:D-alanyl-D-alanine carboxypeptidase/D-alanyl-D-alanine-endopeptidase (penicillin-binding protein 4)
MVASLGRMRILSFAVCLFVVLTACSAPTVERSTSTAAAAGQEAAPRAPTASLEPVSPTPSPDPTLPPGPDRTELVRRLGVATAAFSPDALVSLAVVDALGRVVYSRNGDVPLLPASTAKLLPGAAALTLFGSDHRFETRVDAVGALDTAGVLHGPLVLVGTGEPSLSTADYRTHVYVRRPHAALELLADQVAGAGIKVVTGGLQAAPDLFGETPEAPGWKDGYLDVLDARRITGLTVNAGLAVTVTKPPPDVALHLVASHDPTATAVAIFEQLLADRGVVLWPTIGDPSRPATTIATLAGPTLREHLTFAFERSDNQTADTLMRVVGAQSGARTWQTSGVAVSEVLAGLGVDVAGLVLMDGAGLSRLDAVSALHLASTDQVMRAGPHGDIWREALAEAGSEGTLRRRLRGTVAQGRFLGKTGTLDDVTAVAGTIEGPDGVPAFHMAGMVNLPPGAGRFLDRLVMDDVIALLAEDAAGCTRTAAPEARASGEPVVGGLYVTCPSPAPSPSPSLAPSPSPAAGAP